jgi:hypothetical protein
MESHSFKFRVYLATVRDILSVALTALEEIRAAVGKTKIYKRTQSSKLFEGRNSHLSRTEKYSVSGFNVAF